MMWLSFLSPLIVALPFLILIGLVGRPRPSRPRCRRCRRSLEGTALLPEACPQCGADLRVPRGVRFGGWRPRLLPLLIGMGAIVLLVAPHFLFARASAPTMVVNSVPIAERVSPTAFEEALRAQGAPAWGWLAAHLHADVLTPDLRRLAAARLTEAVRNGKADVDLMGAADLIRRDEGGAELATALLEALEEPTATTLVHGRSGALAVQLDWPGNAAGPTSLWLRNSARSVTFAERDEAQPGTVRLGDFRHLLVISDIRVGGRSVRPKDPEARVIYHLARPTRIALEAPAPDVGGRVPDVEVDLTWAILGNARGALHPRYPGPPSSWSHVIGLRSATLRANVETKQPVPPAAAP
jgi:hypothetical protein